MKSFMPPKKLGRGGAAKVRKVKLSHATGRKKVMTNVQKMVGRDPR
jgi:hypothetical protein